MQTYIPSTDVAVTATLVDSAGVSLTPVAVEYRVIDEVGNVIVGRQAVPAYVTGEAEVVITVPGASNALATGVTYALRVVEFYAQLDTGWVAQESVYKIALLDPLVIPTTSFQTYAEAVLTSTMLSDVDGWNAASKDARLAALAEAHSRLCRLVYEDEFYDDVDYQSRVSLSSEIDLDDLTLAEFTALDADFKAALKKAQIVEADVVLSGDPVAGKREDGLMSESIGESSMMFRPGRAIRLPVSRRAMTILSRYIRNKRVLGRG